MKKNSSLSPLWIVGWALLFFALNSWGADSSTFGGKFDFQRKAKSKQDSRWTLQEWLAQKERNRMMDLWLAMYSPSPYEFYLGGSYFSYTSRSENISATEEKTGQSSGRAQVGAWATVLGIHGEFENNTMESYRDELGGLSLRVAGNAVQGTHLILSGGMRNRTQKSDQSTEDILLRNPFYGADLNLYLNRYIGLMGRYLSFQEVESETLGRVQGSRSEAGVFFDFASLRLHGSYCQDEQTEKLANLETVRRRTGVQTGLQIFF